MTIDRSGKLAASLAVYVDEVNTTQGGAVDTGEVANIVNQFLAEGEQYVAQASLEATTTGVFKRFDDLDMIAGKVEVVTAGLWTGGTGSLTEFYSSSTQDAADSGRYYAVAYGHRTGGGWTGLGEDDNSTLPTKAIYAQYRNILLEPTDTQFTFLSSSDAGTHDSDDIYVINLSRARYREKMDPGNMSLNISGSDNLITLIDDSGKKIDDTVGSVGRIFYVVSGALNRGQPAASICSNYAANGQGFGLFYPDVGIIVLNPTAVSSSAGQDLAPTTTTASDSYNHRKLYEGIRLGGDFEARRTENISTTHYFVRVRNREFNFSNNPTFITGSAGQFRNRSFETDPKVYITTVGLYNNANELLAVAKLSQPLSKSFDREALIRVKLDF